MVILALLTVIQWDSLFPDRRDYTVLNVLPVKLRTLFTAKAAALGALVLIFFGVLNGASLVFFPIAAMEENSSLLRGARFAVSRYRPDFTIIGEPSQWERVTLGYKGSAWARITVRRALAHTAGQGESACEMAVAAWEKIRTSAESLNAGRPRALRMILACTPTKCP